MKHKNLNISLISQTTWSLDIYDNSPPSPIVLPSNYSCHVPNFPWSKARDQWIPIILPFLWISEYGFNHKLMKHQEEKLYNCRCNGKLMKTLSSRWYRRVTLILTCHGKTINRLMLCQHNKVTLVDSGVSIEANLAQCNPRHHLSINLNTIPQHQLIQT